MSKILPLVLGFGGLLLAGCTGIYEPSVQQGNVVTPEMIENLKPGMTRAQVLSTLGTPLVADPFHPGRWDYVHYHRHDTDAAIETRRLTLVFDGDVLSRIEDNGRDATPGAQAPP